MFLAPFMHESAAVVAIISQMITPAIFILATGNLIGGGIARIARVVDRSRVLVDRLPSEKDSEDYRSAKRVLESYKRRTIALEYSLTAYYSAVGFFVAASLFVALSAFARLLVAVPTALTVIGALLVFAGSMSALIEIRIATGHIRNDIDREL